MPLEPFKSSRAELQSLLYFKSRHINSTYLELLRIPLRQIDFSKAFDTVRHSSLQKIAQLHIPEYVYNWILDFLPGHSHCTVYNGEFSELCEITASIIQGSAIGPAMFVVEAADLKAITPGNMFCKYADDTYIIIPASNSHTRTTELEHIDSWTKHNTTT